MKFDIPNIKLLSKHILGICLFIFLEIGMVLIYGTKAHVIDFAIFYSIEILFFYFNAYWLLPLVSRKRCKPVLATGIFIIWVTVSSSISHLIKFSLLRYYGQVIPIEHIWSNWYLAFWRYLLLFALSSSLWYARHSIQSLRRAKDQELEIIKVKERQANLELALLRAQLNPHLMYNALAGVHTYLYLKSPEASEIIIKLSKILELSLRGSDPNFKSTLGDEISFLEHLLDLHRTLQPCYINFDWEVPAEIRDRAFPPNLLVGILENVFKHGILTDQQQPATFSVRYHNGTLKVNSRNLISRSHEGSGFGIGLNNLKQRLEKHFPASYEFSRQMIGQNYYQLTLNIKL